jgi:ribosomal-protein-alanine N-acetyltransferase
MTADDLDAVVHIEYSVTNFPWPRSQFEESLHAGHRCMVLETDYGLGGFAVFSSVLDEATLLDIAVSPHYQGQGLAKQLLTEGLQVLQQQQISQCFLEVRASNQRAINLYKRFGFCQVGERHNYYPAAKGREDAIVMKLQLTTGEAE